MLKIEWLKLKGYRPFWLVMVGYPFILLGLMLMFARFYNQIGSHKEVQAFIAPPFAFPRVWRTTTYIASYFHFIPAVLIMLNICNEFQYRTHRQNLLDGWSRLQFYLAKLAVAGGITLVCVSWVALLGLTFGLYHGGSLSLDGVDGLGYFLLQCSVYNSLAVLLSFFLRRGLLTLALFMVYPMLEKIGLGLIFLFGGKFWQSVSYYGPLYMADHLVPSPYFQKEMAEYARQLAPGAPGLSTFIAVTLGYVVLFQVVSWLTFRRDDL